MKHTNVFFELIKHKDVPILVLEGGSGSSKTYSGLQRVIRRAIKYQGTLTSVVSETLPQLKKGAERDFFNILESENIYNEKNHHQADRIYTFGKSKVEFFSADNMLNALGARRDFLYINEAIRINWDTAYTLIRYTNVQSIIDFNPSFEFWAHTELKRMENVQWIHSTHRDNPYLPEMQRKLLLQRGAIDANFNKVFVEGIVGSNDGLIFPNINIVNDFPSDCKWDDFGLDFGYTNDPTSLIRGALHSGELFFDEYLYETGLINSDLDGKMRVFDVGHKDIIADSADPKSIEDLRRKGWNIRGAVKGQNSILTGIDLMKQYKINVTARSVNMIKEFRNYSWKIDKATGKHINEPGDLFNHALDAARYLCMYKLTRRKELIY